MTTVEQLKKEGNDHFRNGEYDRAISSYTSAIERIEDDNDNDNDYNTDTNSLLHGTLLSNRAACYLQQSDAVAAEEDCNRALEVLREANRITTGTTTRTTSTSTSMRDLRIKLWYRRARSHVLRVSSGNTESDDRRHLNDAATDLLKVLEVDPTNQAAVGLLRRVRKEHAGVSSVTPMASALDGLRRALDSDNDSDTRTAEALRTVHGLLCSDHVDGGRFFTDEEVGKDLGRRGGVGLLRTVAERHRQSKVGCHSLRILASCASHPSFVKTFLHDFSPSWLWDVAISSSSSSSVEETSDGDEFDSTLMLVPSLSLLYGMASSLSMSSSDDGKNTETDAVLADLCDRAIVSGHDLAIRAAMDLLSTWTSPDRHDDDDDGVIHRTEEEIQSLPPREYAAHRQSIYEATRRRKRRGMRRVSFYCRRCHGQNSDSSSSLMASGGGRQRYLSNLLRVAVSRPYLRREIGLILGRMFRVLIDDHEKEHGTSLKDLVKPFLRGNDDKPSGTHHAHEVTEYDGGVLIEEVYDEDDDDDDDGRERQEEKTRSNGISSSSKADLEPIMKRALLVTSLLVADAEVGTWAMTDYIVPDHKFSDLVHSSSNESAQAVASDLVSAAASVEKARPLLDRITIHRSNRSGATSGSGTGPLFEELLHSPYRDVRSGAASAVAKLGLARRGGGDDEEDDEGEVMGLLQVAVELLRSHDDTDTDVDVEDDDPLGIERGIEVLSYLGSKTMVKEELAHGFGSSPSPSIKQNNNKSKSTLDTVVALAQSLSSKAKSYKSQQNKSKSGKVPYKTENKEVKDSSSGSSGTSRTEAPKQSWNVVAYGIASLFAHMAVSVETLKREAFADKDITAEQYEELQNLARTQEERDKRKKSSGEKIAEDPPESVNGRIRRMASADVPRALVSLLDFCEGEGDADNNNDSDDQNRLGSLTTIEQLTLAMQRMAVEPSVRGVMVQQGCLSACIRMEKHDDTNAKNKRSKKNEKTRRRNDKGADGAQPTKDRETRSKAILHSRHCAAKILVTTNPKLLTAAQRLGSVRPLMALVSDHTSPDLAKFEALLSLTNLASTGDDCKDRIVSERGISVLSYAMFTDHYEVRRAATEAMSNLVPHQAFLDHLASTSDTFDKPQAQSQVPSQSQTKGSNGNGGTARIWVSFAADVEDHPRCASAAVGCLAMACSIDIRVAQAVVQCRSFRDMIRSTVMMDGAGAGTSEESEEDGGDYVPATLRLGILHRGLVLVMALLDHSHESNLPELTSALQATGVLAFCRAYVDRYGGHHDRTDPGLDTEADRQTHQVTVELAKSIVLHPTLS